MQERPGCTVDIAHPRLAQLHGIVRFGARAGRIDIQQAFPSLANPDHQIAEICGIIHQCLQADIQTGGVAARNQETDTVSHSRAFLAFLPGFSCQTAICTDLG